MNTCHTVMVALDPGTMRPGRGLVPSVHGSESSGGDEDNNNNSNNNNNNNSNSNSNSSNPARSLFYRRGLLALEHDALRQRRRAQVSVLFVFSFLLFSSLFLRLSTVVSRLLPLASRLSKSLHARPPVRPPRLW